jgi:hypothetical protein
MMNTLTLTHRQLSGRADYTINGETVLKSLDIDCRKGYNAQRSLRDYTLITHPPHANASAGASKCNEAQRISCHSL